MADKQTRKLSETPIAQLGDGHVLVTEIFYSKGGTNMLTGDYNGRGYWLAVRPEQVKDGMRSFVIFEGGKVFLESAKAFSAKRLAAIVPDSEKVAKLQGTVLLEKLNKEAQAAARRS